MKTGAMIKAARQRAGMTLTELGEEIGSAASTLSAIENDQQKNPPSIQELVKISDVLKDRQLLSDFCIACPVRSRIAIRKFRPLNNIVPGVFPALIKTSQKISLASEAIDAMAKRLTNSNFQQDPEYLSFRNAFFLRIIEAMNGFEILVSQAEESSVISHDEFLVLKDMHRQQNVDKGHHVEEEA